MALRHVLPGANVVCAGTIRDAEILAEQRSGFRMALLELMLPDTNGFSGLLRLQFCLPGVPVAIITARKEPGLAVIARDLGAVAFLSKSMPLEQLSHSLREIDAGRSVFPPLLGPKHALPIRDRIASLSQAQRRVLFALADGRANKQIAHDLSITEATVKAHLTAIFRRLQVTNRMQAIIALQPLLGEAA